MAVLDIWRVSLPLREYESDEVQLVYYRRYNILGSSWSCISRRPAIGDDLVALYTWIGTVRRIHLIRIDRMDETFEARLDLEIDHVRTKHMPLSCPT